MIQKLLLSNQHIYSHLLNSSGSLPVDHNLSKLSGALSYKRLVASHRHNFAVLMESAVSFVFLIVNLLVTCIFVFRSLIMFGP